MANTLKLEIVTPEARTYSDDVEMVTLAGVEGEMGVYPQHVPLMTQLAPGEITVRKNGQEFYLAVGDGFVEISHGFVAVALCLARIAGYFFRRSCKPAGADPRYHAPRKAGRLTAPRHDYCARSLSQDLDGVDPTCIKWTFV